MKFADIVKNFVRLSPVIITLNHQMECVHHKTIDVDSNIHMISWEY